MTEQTNNNSKNKIVIILLAVLLLGSGGLSFWQYSKYKELQEQFNQSESERLEALSDKDSLELSIAELEEKLLNIENEREELAFYSDSLENEINEMKRTIANMKSRLANASPEEIARLKREVAEAKQNIDIYLKQIEELKAENAELREKGEELEEEIQTLTVVNKALDNKVKIASELQFAPIKVVLGKTKRSGFKEQEKARSVKEIHFEIDLIENPIVDAGKDYELKVRVIDPEKQVLSSVSDNKDLVDKSQVYTLKKNVSYSGSAQHITLKYEPEFKLQKGEYKIEFYSNNELKQTGSFELK